MCDGTNHNLIEIYRTGYEDKDQDVVRWCTDCGAIAVDSDMDNRTYPGRIVSMKFPKMIYANDVEEEIIQ